MTTISPIKLFESTQILDEATRKNVEPLISFINENFDQLTRCLQRGITPENVDSEITTLEFTHGQSKEIVLREPQRLLSVSPMRILHATDSTTSFKWSITSGGAVQVTIWFREATTDRRTVTIRADYR